MTDAAAAARHWASWEAALGEEGLVSYRYVQCSSRATSPSTAVGGYRLRRDLRTEHGALLLAPLGIAMLDTAGINVDARAVVAPTQIDLSVVETRAGDIDAVVIHGNVVRAGRTQMVTEARVHDAGDAGHVLAIGTATWAVVAPAPPGYRYVDPRAGVADDPRSGAGADPDLPPAFAVFGARRRADDGYELAGLSPRVGAESLHQGPIQVLLEAAARDVAGTGCSPRHSATSIVQRGTTGPFVATAELLGASGEVRAIRAELRDEGADRVIAVSFQTYGMQEPRPR